MEDREKQKAFAEEFAKLSPQQRETKVRDALDTPDEIKVHMLERAGWKQPQASFLWIQPEDRPGIYFTLGDAYQIQVNRAKLQPEPQPSPAVAGYLHPQEGDADRESATLNEMAADFLRYIEDGEKTMEVARQRIAGAASRLREYGGHIKDRTLLVQLDGRYCLLRFNPDGSIVPEEAVTPEEVEREIGI